MNGNENSFETVRALLKLKQHEIPPPGFFHGFSDQVISRIRAGEAGGSHGLAERLESTAPWLVNFLQIFETKPGLIGALATSLCLLLTLGVVVGDHTDVAPRAILPPVEFASGSVSATTMTAPTVAVAVESTGIVASTNPATSLQPVTTLFGQPQPNTSLFQSASFSSAGAGN